MEFHGLFKFYKKHRFGSVCLSFYLVLSFFDPPLTPLCCLVLMSPRPVVGSQWRPSRATLTSCWSVEAAHPAAMMAWARPPSPCPCSTGRPRQPHLSVCNHSCFMCVQSPDSLCVLCMFLCHVFLTKIPLTVHVCALTF